MIFYLTGYMGCGKSSIGREVARRTGYGFVDTDREVEKMHGYTVADIFEHEGEEAFRTSEREVLLRIAAEGGNVIVATGGGAPCHGDNMEMMNATGKTVYLKLSPGKLVQRLKPGQTRRPKLSGMDRGQMLEYIAQNLPLRENIYARSSMTVGCDTLSDDSICRHVADYIGYCENVSSTVCKPDSQTEG